MDRNSNRPGGVPSGPIDDPGVWQDRPPGYPAYPGYPHASAYPGYPGAAGGSGAGVDLFQVLQIFKRHVKLIAATTAVGILAALAWVMVEEPEYEATAVIRVGEAREVVTQGIETPMREDDAFVNPFLSAIQLLTSGSLLGEVVDNTGLRLTPDSEEFSDRLLHSTRVDADKRPDTLQLVFTDAGLWVRDRGVEMEGFYGEPVSINGVTFVVESRPSVSEATWTIKPREQVIDKLREDLRVQPREETNVVDLSFSNPSPAIAQRVVNTLAEAYQRFEGQFAQERATRRRAFLEEQLQETEGRLGAAQRSLSAFQTRSQSYDAAGELAAESQNRMMLRVQIAELQSERRIAAMMLDSLDMAVTPDDRWAVLRTLVSSPGIAENAVVSQMHGRLLNQRSTLDSLTAGGFGAAGSSPEVQRQEELVDAAEQDLTNAIRSHVRSLVARAGALEELSARTDSALATIPAQLAQADRLEQVVSTYQTLSDQLREDLQRARMAEEVTVGRADIIDLATLPYEPAPSLAVVKLGLGLILGLSFGGVGAIVAEYRRSSLSSKEEVEELFQLPVLGVIPKSSDPKTVLSKTRVLVGSREGGGPGGSDPGPEGTAGTTVGPVVGNGGTQSIYSREAFRMLCTNLLFAGATKDAKTLSITSTLPQEGKTLVTTNLAVALAREGLKVLLVDADVWRGRVHEVFDVPAAPGLSDVLRGEAAVSDLLGARVNGSRAIHSTTVPGLFLLPRGHSGASPSLLGRGTPLRAILEELEEEFDFVLVDGPPVLAAGTAPVLSAATDGVVMLVQAGRTERAAIQEALRGLHTVGANVRGAILNDPTGLTTADLNRYHYYEYAKS